MTRNQEIIESIYNSIQKRSILFEVRKGYLAKELKSSKNFICTPDFKHWTFGKSVGRNGDYHGHGGAAKKHLQSLGFEDIYKTSKELPKEEIIAGFCNWAERIGEVWLIDKLERREEFIKSFELYVYIPNVGLKQERHKINFEGLQSEFDEGHRREISREVGIRNYKLRTKAKEKYGTNCAVCDFNFGNVYGDYGKGFIEIHHLYPISKGKRVSKVEDVRPVCANCHRMMHRGKELLSIEELKEIIKRR